MIEMEDEFLSEEDLDLRDMPWDEVVAYSVLWLRQAQATNHLDEAFYSHGVFVRDPAVPVPEDEELQLRPPAPPAGKSP